MAIHRKAEAVWNGTLREGNGTLSTDSGTLNNTPFTFVSRFEEGSTTNPEELLAAAHAGCFTMALGASLGRKGFTVHHVKSTATLELAQKDGAWSVTKISLVTRGKVDGIDADAFKQAAEETKKNCIVSRALAAVEMEVDAALE